MVGPETLRTSPLCNGVLMERLGGVDSGPCAAGAQALPAPDQDGTGISHFGLVSQYVSWRKIPVSREYEFAEEMQCQIITTGLVK